MEHHDSNSPATSESQTPTFPVRVGGNAGGSAPMSGMMPGTAPMMQQPQMAGMMPGYYNMYPPWMASMPGMMPQMPQMSGMNAAMPGMMPQMPGMNAAMPGRIPQMPVMLPGPPAAAGGSRQGVPQSPGDNVYRPYMNLLSSDSPQSTPLETQFTGIETFSFEELGLSPIRESPTQMPAAAGRTQKQRKGKGKGKGTTSSSRAGAEGGKRKPGGESGPSGAYGSASRWRRPGSV